MCSPPSARASLDPREQFGRPSASACLRRMTLRSLAGIRAFVPDRVSSMESVNDYALAVDGEVFHLHLGKRSVDVCVWNVAVQQVAKLGLRDMKARLAVPQRVVTIEPEHSHRHRAGIIRSDRAPEAIAPRNKSGRAAGW